MKLDLPELNSPAITRRKSPASCSVASLKRWRSAAGRRGRTPPARGEAPQQLLLPGPQVLLAVREERSPPEQPPDHK